MMYVSMHVCMSLPVCATTSGMYVHHRCIIVVADCRFKVPSPFCFCRCAFTAYGLRPTAPTPHPLPSSLLPSHHGRSTYHLVILGLWHARTPTIALIEHWRWWCLSYGGGRSVPSQGARIHMPCGCTPCAVPEKRPVSHLPIRPACLFSGVLIDTCA